MPSKKRAKKAQTKQSQRMIRYVGIAVVLVVVAIFIWMVFPRKPKTVASNSPACQVFGSIPAASKYNAPPMSIDVTKKYFATFTMEKGGTFVVQLYPDKAPVTVNSFVFLACKGFFNGVTFHRVIDGFMAQGGDPTGTGQGGPGYQFKNEDSDLTFDKPGVVAMANAGRDTNGSQFFITFVLTSQLNGGYTIFGQVTDGMDVVNGIKRRDPQTNPTYEGDKIATITISEE